MRQAINLDGKGPANAGPERKKKMPIYDVKIQNDFGANRIIVTAETIIKAWERAEKFGDVTEIKLIEQDENGE